MQNITFVYFFIFCLKSRYIVCVDLDTILPIYFASVIKGKNRVYDAHELFTEQKEIVTRPSVQSSGWQ
jgi:hypothetical protein